MKLDTFGCNKPESFIKLYEKELEGRKITRLLEIGVQKGRSLRMWAKAFPEAEIVGLDLNEPTEEIPETNIKFVQGNQADLLVLDKLGDFDVIIDDGSHRTDDQIRSFKFLIHHLSAGGLYFMEDVETSYVFDYINGQTFVEYAKGLIDFVNRQQWFRRILFMDDLIMIEKI